MQCFGHAGGIKRSAHNVIAHTRQIFYFTAAHQHYGVFLEIVAFAGDVGDDFLTIGQADLGDFAQGGIGFLGGAGHDLNAHAAALRAIDQRR